MSTLADVKHYMEEHGRATVSDLAIRFGTTPDMIRSLLEIWSAKHRVRRLESACGSCGRARFGGCNCPDAPMLLEVYEWVAPQEGGG